MLKFDDNRCLPPMTLGRRLSFGTILVIHKLTLAMIALPKVASRFTLWGINAICTHIFYCSTNGQVLELQHRDV